MILDADYADRIRNKIGVDEIDLPTEAIDEIRPVVEAKMARNYPNPSEDDKIYLEAATVSMIAANLCMYLRTRIPVSERGPHGAFEMAQDWTQLKDWLEDDVTQWLAMLADSQDETLFVPHFVLGGSTR